MIKQFLEHRMAVAGLTLITIFVLLAVGAPVITTVFNLNPETQNIHARYLPPFSFAEMSSGNRETEIETFIDRNPELVEQIIAFSQTSTSIAVFGPITASGADEVIFDLMEKLGDASVLVQAKELHHQSISKLVDIRESFRTYHLLGTDELGRDVVMRLLYGTRVSIGIGVSVALISALFGLFIGAVAGHYGGMTDSILMRMSDSLMAIPILPVLIVLAAVDFTKIPFMSFFVGTENESVVKLFIILCAFSWMTVARVVRGNVLSIREREFIIAAKSIGASSSRIIWVHIVPNVLAPVLVAVTLNVGNAILFEAALSFLGLGVQPPIPSWGNMLFNAQELIFEAPWLAIFPGFLIFLVVVSFNFLGDGLQHARGSESSS